MLQRVIRVQCSASWTARKKRTQTRNWPTWATSARKLWNRFAIWYCSYLKMVSTDSKMLLECPGIALSPRHCAQGRCQFLWKTKMTENDNFSYQRHFIYYDIDPLKLSLEFQEYDSILIYQFNNSYISKSGQTLKNSSMKYGQKSTHCEYH